MSRLTFTRLLTLPAPANESVELPGGGFYSRAWTTSGVLEALDAGMWFESTSRHNFDSRESRALAMNHYWRLPRDDFGRIFREKYTPTPKPKPFQQGRGRKAI